MNEMGNRTVIKEILGNDKTLPKKKKQKKHASITDLYKVTSSMRPNCFFTSLLLNPSIGFLKIIN